MLGWERCGRRQKTSISGMRELLYITSYCLWVPRSQMDLGQTECSSDGASDDVVETRTSAPPIFARCVVHCLVRRASSLRTSSACMPAFRTTPYLLTFHHACYLLILSPFFLSSRHHPGRSFWSTCHGSFHGSTRTHCSFWSCGRCGGAGSWAGCQPGYYVRFDFFSYLPTR